MRNLLKSISLLVMLTCYNAISKGQPQWKFHLAFEDATGAKDTIWMIWDTTAHFILPVDEHLGEGRVEMNLNEFNVFILNHNNDSTKTISLNYNSFGIGIEIKAFNYQLPIKLRWDSVMFNAPFLPGPAFKVSEATLGNDYFFGVNNDPSLHHLYNMLLDNEVLMPEYDWGSRDHFPLFVNIGRYLETNVQNLNSQESIYLYPNPSKDFIKIKTDEKIETISIYNVSGQTLMKLTNSEFVNENIVDISNLKSGIYYVNIKTPNTQYHEKIIKIN